jgi:hypothetical protein
LLDAGDERSGRLETVNLQLILLNQSCFGEELANVLALIALQL